ncbi:hypothetical protein ABRP29_06060 [Pseudomonas sp. WHRI 8822A]|uniref:hypothetical protein n=1 Tax=Pseudomonas sp. WHRI 8822A TaxID=3162568 RepID=UPI0032ED5068
MKTLSIQCFAAAHIAKLVLQQPPTDEDFANTEFTAKQRRAVCLELIRITEELLAETEPPRNL